MSRQFTARPVARRLLAGFASLAFWFAPQGALRAEFYDEPPAPGSAATTPSAADPVDAAPVYEPSCCEEACDCCQAPSCTQQGCGDQSCNCLHCRPRLLSCCCRDALAADGVVFDFNVTQWYMGPVSGGVSRDLRYAGHGDYVMLFDGQKLGLWEGFFLKMRAEHRFGEPVGLSAGSAFPPNILANLPVSDSEDLYLTDVTFVQALSENFAVFAGKVDTLDGDKNAFAHGRGMTQFNNLGFVANPIALRTIPYSTLGAGFMILENRETIFQFSCLNATDTTETSGFKELGSEGVALAAELRLPTDFFGMLGHQLIAGTWSSREFTSIGQDPRVLLPEVPIARQDGSWSLYYNFDQYLVMDSENPAHGWGLFGRLGIADDNTNPLAWYASAGFGGNSPLRSRPADTFGVGYYYAGTSDEIGPLIENVLGPIGDGQGVELFYNVAVTPWFTITPDIQVLVPAVQSLDTALVVGARANLAF